MSEAVHGKNVLVEMQLDDLSWMPIFCGTDMSLTYEPEFITITGPNSPSREYMVRLEDWSMSVSGLTKIANDTVLTFFFMMQQAIRRALRTYRAKFVDDVGAVKIFTMTAYVGRSTISGPVSDFSLGTIEFRGSGGAEISDSEGEPVVQNYDYLSDWWTTTNGNAFINGASSVHGYTLTTADYILDVAVEGMGSFIITSGSPGNNEAKPDLVNNKILFLNTFDGSQRVYVEFKRPI